MRSQPTTMLWIACHPRMMLGLMLAVVLGLSFISSLPLQLQENRIWYDSLEKSSLTPPDRVFGIVWPLLYLCITVAAWRIWRQQLSFPTLVPSILMLFALHLAANLLWTWMFFGRQSIMMGYYWLLLVWLMALSCTLVFWRLDRVAGWLMLPYLAWLSFAAYLSWMIYALNR